MASDEIYDSSWDEDNENLWDKKYAEWENRDWQDWLSDNLVFPFEVKRKEDLDRNPFLADKNEPFSLWHVMKVLSIEDEDESYGIIVRVKEGNKTGHVPLCDLEVTSRKNNNFWPVREYVVWFANR